MPDRQLYSIGHSNHSLETFLDLLHRHEIEVLVDVRSQPYSQYAPHFNYDQLQKALEATKIRFLFLGKELGGRPNGDEFYDEEGHVRYDRLAESALFLEGIGRLEKGAERFRVAMMCSEENPAVCHRYLLIGRILDKQGVRVVHIRGDGRLESDADIETQAKQDDDADQGMLFGDLKEEPPWRSLRSVSPRRPPPSSLES